MRAIILSLTLLVIGACASQGPSSFNYNRLDLQIVTVDTPTDLIRAAREGDHAGIRRALEQGDLINAVAPEGSAFSVAIRQGYPVIASFLLSAGANWRTGFPPGQPSALMLASERGENRLVKQLILNGAALDDTDNSGYSALTLAAMKGHLTTMSILINAGADVDNVADGKSILMHVVEDNNVLLSQRLIKAGADVNYRDENGDTALRIARRKGFFDIDLMLVQAGARP